MNRLLLAAVIIFAGCVGSSTPRNPMDGNPLNKIWWQDNTEGVKSSDNPWNKYLPKATTEDTSDPWANFQEPDLFPKDWKPREVDKLSDKIEKLKLYEENRKLKKFIELLLQPKVEKTREEKLKDLRKREKKFFNRSI